MTVYLPRTPETVSESAPFVWRGLLDVVHELTTRKPISEARLRLRRRGDGASPCPPVDERDHDPVVEEERQVAEGLARQLGEVFQVPCKPLGFRF